MVFEILKAT